VAEAHAFTSSLNLSTLAALPGLPEPLRGARAFDWLSSVGIARHVRERLPGIDLAPVPDEPLRDALIAAVPYPRFLDAMVAAGDGPATALADDLGAALAGLLATLVIGHPDARASRPDWPADHWERWAAVRRVVLGGGIVSGTLGTRLVASATAWLPCLGAGDVRLVVADDPASLALRGAGCGLPDGGAVLVDAGLTWIKAAWAGIRGGRCVSLGTVSRRQPPRDLRAGALADALADAAADAAHGSAVSAAGFSVATETDATGQPLDGQPGLYGSLGSVPLARRLADRLRSASATPSPCGRPTTATPRPRRWPAWPTPS
jgi:hypothetical protein